MQSIKMDSTNLNTPQLIPPPLPRPEPLAYIEPLTVHVVFIAVVQEGGQCPLEVVL